MKGQKIKLNKTNVEALPAPEAGQKIYWDSELLCFGVRVTPGCKTYIVQSCIRGKDVRYTIGRHGKITADQARTIAKEKLGEFARGINPNQAKKDERAKSVTLGEVWERYRTSKNLRPSTLQGYQYVLKLGLSDWLNKPMNTISKDMVEIRYKQLCSKVGPHSKEDGAKALACACMRLLRSLWNFASEVYEDGEGTSILGSNPVQRLKGQWHKIPRRKRHVPKHRLADFLNAVDAVQNEVIRDFIRILLFTGLRKNEAASLRWIDIELHPEMRYLCLEADRVKNHQEHGLPLGDYVYEVLKRRSQNKKADSEYVFPGDGKLGHLTEPKVAFKFIEQRTGIHVSSHDMRRTFLTIAEGIEIPFKALKRLVNHKDPGDVTSGYIYTDIDRLRKPMQQIEDFILVQAGRKQSIESELAASQISV
ncbi:MAG: integrase [Cyanobacteria bacterium PR.3.49]|nr:integrase [Cyanobacteria bacterium PR.3.49]